MDINPSFSPEQQPQSEVTDFVDVEFRPDALVRFRESFADLERAAVLKLLVEHAGEGVEVAKHEEFPVRLLTLFRVRFRYIDCSDIDKLVVLSLENGNNDSPPPGHKAWRGPVIAGGVSGLVRWLLGQIAGRNIHPSSNALTLKADTNVIYLVTKTSDSPFFIRR